MSFDIVEEYGVGYNVLISGITGSDNFYHKVYYKENSSTIFRDKATVINSDTDAIEITLMKKNIISGKINTDGKNLDFQICAVYQKDKNIRDDIYDSSLVYWKYYTDYDNNYKIAVPAELSDFIIVFKPNSREFVYYSSNGTKNDVNGAELLNMNGDLDNIDIEYTQYSIDMPLEITSVWKNIYVSGEVWKVFVYNGSDLEQNNIVINACFYDDSERLLGVVTDTIDIPIKPNLTVNMEFGGLYNNASVVKLLLWNENMRPMSMPYCMKTELGLDNSDNADADIVLGSGNAKMLVFGKEIVLDTPPIILNDFLLVPVRAMSEALHINVSWNDTNQSAIFKDDNTALQLTVDSYIGLVNGKSIVVDACPKLINDRVLIPAQIVAEYFGYKTEWNSSKGILKINSPE